MHSIVSTVESRMIPGDTLKLVHSPSDVPRYPIGWTQRSPTTGVRFMRSTLHAAMYVLAASCCLFASAHATYNATVIGTVEVVQQISGNLPGYTPETVSFTISGQPTVACGSFQQFVISPTTVTDVQTRKNMLAILLTAKATGAPLQVAYDSTGGFCDQGMVAVYYLAIR